jgi:hypothetical protein
MKHVKLRPRIIKVFGRAYGIYYEPVLSFGVPTVGMCDNYNLEIYVLEGQHPVEEANNLIHELLIAIWFTMSIDHEGLDEEGMVRSLASGLVGVFLDNPKLLAYLKSIKGHSIK